jgi:ribulose-phosphate 3-epimerase
MDAKRNMPLILPSLLSAPFAHLGQSLRVLEDVGVSLFHYDVMDGHFVPNLSGSPAIIDDLQTQLHSQFDVHLMVDNPSKVIPWFDFPSVRSISIHVEASQHLRDDFEIIRSRGKWVGVVVNPPTPVSSLDHFLEIVNHVLVMTVNPGMGGQSLIQDTLPKIEYCAQKRAQLNLDFIIQVDGGVNENTIRSVRDAGADEIVAGSAIFDRDHPVEAYRNLNRLVGNTD